MATVLVFARLLEDKDVKNNSKLALDFNTENDTTINLTKNVQFQKKESVTIGETVFQKYYCAFYRIGRKKIIHNGTIIRKYEIPEEFYAYRETTSDVIFFDIKTDTAIQFIKKINTLNSTPIFSQIEFNFLELATKVHTVLGSWFRFESAGISSQSIHGANIEQSIPFQELSERGEITSLNIAYIYRESHYMVSVSGKGSLYLSEKIEPRHEEFSLLIKLFHELII